MKKLIDLCKMILSANGYKKGTIAILNIIWCIILAVLLAPLVALIMLIREKKGLARRYHNVKAYDSLKEEEWSSLDQFIKFSIMAKPQLITAG